MSVDRKKAKKKAWDQFSIFIRTRDCIRTTGTIEIGCCVTCYRQWNFKQLQAGHFISGRNNAVLFQEQGVHAQCDDCNALPPRGKGGNPTMYWQFMLDTYGRDIIDKLIKESSQTIKYSVLDYEQVLQKYKEKTQLILADYSLAVLNLEL